MTTPLVEIENLRVAFPREDGNYAEAVRGVSYTMGREKLGIVGESGSGKSLSSRALLQVQPSYARVSADHLRFDGIDVMRASPRELRHLRGHRIGMILQDPKYSLNPVVRVGTQIVEAARLSSPGLSRRAAREETYAMLEAVRIRDPRQVYNQYPHELSGGMGQRVMIAMMLIQKPDLLIADEPTSALDVSVRDAVLELLDEMVTERNMGLILISHDLKVVQRFCDRFLVMYQGRVVEELARGEAGQATHPYTQALLQCVPTLGTPRGPLPVVARDADWTAEGV